MAQNIEGKVVVVTGASSGLGEAAVRHLAADGAKIVIGARPAWTGLKQWPAHCHWVPMQQ
jgi:NADP-dependent 3-hydroxy acid dehydrogenase YdfG